MPARRLLLNIAGRVLVSDHIKTGVGVPSLFVFRIYTQFCATPIGIRQYRFSFLPMSTCEYRCPDPHTHIVVTYHVMSEPSTGHQTFTRHRRPKHCHKCVPLTAVFAPTPSLARMEFKRGAHFRLVTSRSVRSLPTHDTTTVLLQTNALICCPLWSCRLRDISPPAGRKFQLPACFPVPCVGVLTVSRL